MRNSCRLLLLEPEQDVLLGLAAIKSLEGFADRRLNVVDDRPAEHQTNQRAKDQRGQRFEQRSPQFFQMLGERHFCLIERIFWSRFELRVVGVGHVRQDLSLCLDEGKRTLFSVYCNLAAGHIKSRN